MWSKNPNISAVKFKHFPIFLYRAILYKEVNVAWKLARLSSHFKYLHDILWSLSCIFKTNVFYLQTTVTTKETVEFTTLDPKDHDLAEEEEIQYGGYLQYSVSGMHGLRKNIWILFLFVFHCMLNLC